MMVRCSACNVDILEKDPRRCLCGTLIFCSASCYIETWNGGHSESCIPEQKVSVDVSIGNPIASKPRVKFGNLRKVLANDKKTLEQAKEIFSNHFPIEYYPFKVMGYNRLTRKPLNLSPNRVTGIASLFSHQRLNRDFRGPWNSLRGGIIKAPTGAGKTATMHAILGNYRREKIKLKTPQGYYLKSKNDKEESVHRTLIYVTKRDNVFDVPKDLYAQMDRSQDQFGDLLKANDIPHSKKTAPFNIRGSNSHIMSYKTFQGMLTGSNTRGRLLWAGFDIGQTGPKFKQIGSTPADRKIMGITPVQQKALGTTAVVPTAYRQTEDGSWTRGNRPHQIITNQGTNLGILVKGATQRKPGGDELLNMVKQFHTTVLIQQNFGIIKFRDAKHSLSTKGSGSRKKNLWSIPIFIDEFETGASIPSVEDWALFVENIQKEIKQIFAKYLSAPSSSITVTALVPSEKSVAKGGSGWLLDTARGKNTYTWRPTKDDEKEVDFNPLDRLVVVFDEADLLFNPDKLQGPERANAYLIVQALMESNGVIVYFTSATIDMFDGLRMLKALLKDKRENGSDKEPIIPELEEEETPADYLEAIEENKGQWEKIKNASKGLISVVTIEGMRDIFPEKIYDTNLIEVPLSQSHAKSVVDHIDNTTATLSEIINLEIKIDNRLDVMTQDFDPDYALETLLKNDTVLVPTDEQKTSPFPLGRKLLEQLHIFDDNESSKMTEDDITLTGRGIITSSPRESVIKAVAAVMVALGYRWKYLEPAPKITDPDIIRAKTNARSRGEPIRDEWRSVRWAEKPLEHRASEQTIGRLNLMPFSPITTNDQSPQFVVLANTMLVKKLGQTVNFKTREGIVKYAESQTNFVLPYKLLSNKTLLENGLSAEGRKSIGSSTTPKLHFYPATETAQKAYHTRYEEDKEKREVEKVFFEKTKNTPVFFLVKKNPKRFVIIDLPIDPNDKDLNEDKLALVAERDLGINPNEKEDAKQMILNEYNKSLQNMRETNLRYICISRAFNQGIDVHNTTEVFNLDPAPDRATEIQRRGRFARPGSHSDLPFDEWKVTYHTFLATYPVGFKAPTGSTVKNLLAEGITIDGDKAILDAIEEDPVTLSKTVGNIKSDTVLLPYHLVRIKTEVPSITLKRLSLENIFDSWAIDFEHNKILIDTHEKPIYSPTNYVISLGYVKKLLETQLQQLGSAKDMNTLQSEYMATNPPPSDMSKMGDYMMQAMQWAVSQTQNMTAQTASSDLLKVQIDSLSGKEEEYAPTRRRLTEDPNGRHISAVFNIQEDRTDEIKIDPQAFGLDENLPPYRLIQSLVERGISLFDPQFEFDVTKVPKRPAPKAPKAPAKKKPKQTKVKTLIDYEHHSISFPDILIGRVLKIKDFQSFSTIIEQTASPDEEQEHIEQTVKQNHYALMKILEYHSDIPNNPPGSWATTYHEKLADSIYKKLPKGTTSITNHTMLKNSLLILHRFGITNWNTALEMFAHAFHEAYKYWPKNMSVEKRRQELERISSDVGMSYVLSAFTNINTIKDIKQRLTNGKWSDQMAGSLLKVVYWYTVKSKGIRTIDHLFEFIKSLQDTYHIITSKSGQTILEAFSVHINKSKLQVSDKPNLDLFKSLNTVGYSKRLKFPDGIVDTTPSSDDQRKAYINHIVSELENLALDVDILDQDLVFSIVVQHTSTLSKLEQVANDLLSGKYGKLKEEIRTIDDLIVHISNLSSDKIPEDSVYVNIYTFLKKTFPGLDKSEYIPKIISSVSEAISEGKEKITEEKLIEIFSRAEDITALKVVVILETQPKKKTLTESIISGGVGTDIRYFTKKSGKERIEFTLSQLLDGLNNHIFNDANKIKINNEDKDFKITINENNIDKWIVDNTIDQKVFEPLLDKFHTEFTNLSRSDNPQDYLKLFAIPSLVKRVKLHDSLDVTLEMLLRLLPLSVTVLEKYKKVLEKIAPGKFPIELLDKVDISSLGDMSKSAEELVRYVWQIDNQNNFETADKILEAFNDIYRPEPPFDKLNVVRSAAGQAKKWEDALINQLEKQRKEEFDAKIVEIVSQ